MNARITRGVLYSHPRRPEWGVGLVTGLGEGRATLAWSDGAARTILDPASRLVRADPRKVGAERTREAKPAKAKPRKAKKAKPRAPKTSRRRGGAERDARIRELYETGQSDDQIGRELAVSAKTVARTRMRLGLQRCQWRLSGEVVEQILDMRRQGVSAKKIAAALGRSECGVVGVITRHGLPTRGPHWRRPWTDDDDAALVRLCAEGLTDEQIGRQIGRTRPAVARRRAVTHGIPKGREEWPAEELEALAEGLAAGRSIRRLAEDLGRSYWATRQRVLLIRGCAS